MQILIYRKFLSPFISPKNCRIACKPQLGTLSSGATLLVKLANWEFAIRNTDGTKYSGQYINENKVITDGNYVRYFEK